jgi:polysaccharide deacetylase 2 family uncharacterized protein YibQ
LRHGPAVLAALSVFTIGASLGLIFGPAGFGARAPDNAVAKAETPAKRANVPPPYWPPAYRATSTPQPVPPLEPTTVELVPTPTLVAAAAPTRALPPRPALLPRTTPVNLPPASAMPGYGARPPWLAYAVPAAANHGRPVVAIVLDDLGLDRRRSQRSAELPGPLTHSYMSYAPDLREQSEYGRRRGHELMLHLPMEPEGPFNYPGPNALMTGLSAEENLRRLYWSLDRFEGFVGVNNHMGSRFTASREAMTLVLAELNRRGLLFLDSRTGGRSVGTAVARDWNVPHAGRDVFLDDIDRPEIIRQRLADVEATAYRHGHAIAIGHPREHTLDALEPWLRGLAAKGLVLVPVSAIVRARMAAE